MYQVRLALGILHVAQSCCQCWVENLVPVIQVLGNFSHLGAFRSSANKFIELDSCVPKLAWPMLPPLSSSRRSISSVYYL
jgi:hypothetical protein